MKYSTDGAVLSNKRNAVQGTIKIIDVDDDGRPLPETELPQYLQKEITMYYYLGIVIEYHTVGKSIPHLNTTFYIDLLFLLRR